MKVVTVLVLTVLPIGCGRDSDAHQWILAQGPPDRSTWAQLPVTGTLGWLYDPRSVARGDGKAYVWTRLPLTSILLRYGFDCRRHLASAGPTVTYSVDSITNEDDRVTDWDVITIEEEPLYQLACAGA